MLPIPAEDRARHRAEAAALAAAVDGDEVEFRFGSYAEWLAGWPADGPVAEHGRALRASFSLH